MYLRLTQRRNRDGSVVRYVQLAQNRRVDGRPRAEVVANLGREDRIDIDALRGLVASIGRYLDKMEPAAAPQHAAADEPPPPSELPGAVGAGAPDAPPAATPFGPGWAGPPAGANRLFGRDRALSDLPALLSRHPLVTITGPAGVGKTRLAAEFVHRARARYRKGLWWADLAPLPPGSPVDSVVAAALGVGAEPGRSPRQTIADVCGGGPAMLVLDNCEHVLDGCAQLVTWLLSACPKLRMVATSREGLGVPGETLFTLSPLAVPNELSGGSAPTISEIRAADAVRLFVDRGGAAAPGFELTDEFAVMVGRLCALLDGLPLAIELTARQLTTLALPQLLQRLDDKMTLLTGGGRSGSERHRSLHSAIGWSYRLLDPREQAVFRRLCAMPGGFDEVGAAAICADLELPDADLWAVLRALVDKSMVAAVGAVDVPIARFRILESLRTFGVGRLQHEGEADGTRERLLDYLTDVASPMITEALVPGASLVRLVNERHNLNHAVHLLEDSDDTRYPILAVGLAYAVRRQGQVQHSRQLLLRVLARHREPTPGRACALSALATTENWAGDYAAARRYAEEALALGRRLGSRALQQKASQRLALALCNLGDYAAGVALAARMVESLRTSGNGNALPIALNDLAWFLTQYGDLAAAARVVDEALSVLSADEKAIWNDIMHTAGTVAFKQGRLDRARHYFSVALAADVSFAAQVPFNLEGLALVAGAADQPRRSLRLFAAAATARSTTGRRRADPWWSRLCEEGAGSARNRLTATRAASATAEGTALNIQEAIRYALLDHWPPTRRAKASPLTTREHQVARLVADGLTNSQIAARLGVSVRTVVSHLEHIRSKLDLRTRTEIAAWTAREHG